MKPAPLSGRFARRMAPLAVLAGLLLGFALPAINEAVLLRERAAEAAVWAQQIARRVEALARARPELWPYDHPSLLALTAELTEPPVSARIRIDSATGDRRFEIGPLGRSVEVAGWALVRVGEDRVGRVEARIDAAETRKNARWFWAAASATGTVLAVGLFILPLLTVRRADRRDEDLWIALEEANTTLEARVADRTSALRQRERELVDLGCRLMTVQEEERARISRNLHDELGQTLTALRLRLASVAERLESAHSAREDLNAAVSALDAGVDQVRGLAHNLRPPELDALGLADALRGHAEAWADASGLEIELCIEAITPGAEAAEALFRIAQEALTNIARHACAGRAKLTLDRFDDGWRLIVADDGQGLGAELSPTGRKRLGILGAQERVEALGGYLDIESGSELGGARLLAWLPLEEVP